MNKTYLLLSLFLLALPAQAYQRLSVQEGPEIQTRISTKALNRIAVEQDRIVSVKGNAGEFELDKDVEVGQIFVKSLVTERFIPIFISTEQGHTYSLSLFPDEREAENIVLAPLQTLPEWQRASSYESLLQTLIQAMHRQSPLEGFIIERKKVSLPRIKDVKLTVLQSYLGASLLGQILEVSNTGKEPLSLTETDFYRSGVRAVSIPLKTLEPKAKTLVYWISHHE